MKKKLIGLLSLVIAFILALGVAVSALEVSGDVNGDGECNLADVFATIEAVLNRSKDSAADVNGDGKVSLADVIKVLKFASANNLVGETTSADVSVSNGEVAAEVTLNGENISATVPEGVAVDEGTTSLTLSVTEMEASKGNITLGENDEAVSYDVHIAGVADNNTKVIIVKLGAVLPVGQNDGNVALYHVEDGVTTAMTEVKALDELDKHNEFYYDVTTGEVTVALATFSEIAVVADTVNAWNGTFDYTWYENAVAPLDGESATEYKIASADQLAGFGAIVGGMNGQTQDSFAGKTVTLIADINLGDKESENKANIIFYPIGYYNSEGTYEKGNTAITSGFKTFEGTFDGAGHTISNFYQNTWEMKGDNNYYDATLQYYRDGMGLFGKVYGGTVKNLTVSNFSSDGEYTTTGTIAAYADCGATFENITIFNCNPRVYNIGNGGIVGCVGWYTNDTTTDKVTFKNITVDNSNKISALWGSWDVACGGLVGQYYPTSGQGNGVANAGVHFENCHVAAQIDVYNDVCANYQYYAYRYAGMIIGSIRENVETDGHVYPKMDGITAKDCTVHFGDWNDYYYCELVANSLASYTHDHQMSRLTQVASVDVANKTVTSLDGETTEIPTSGRVNYVVVKSKDANGMWIHGDGHNYAECYHFVNGVQHLHDIADADNPTPTETVDGVAGVLKEDKQLVYREFNQLFTGYGWGVTSKGLTDFEGVDTDIKIEESEQEESVEKFELVFKNTENYLYRVGNQNTVSLGSLFKAKDSVTINNSGVYVTIDPVDDDIEVSGEFTESTTDSWADGTIKFSGTGPVKVTIQDYDYCLPTELYLEVVEATNATAAANATSNNVVLLNDIGSGFTVSGNYTFYGNGFTLNYTGNGQYLNNGLRQGLVMVSENGTLDNLRIEATIYPSAYMYYGKTLFGDYVQGGPSTVDVDKTRYHYQLSAVAAKGNATISNCYIYGGRTNIFVDTGDVTVKDTILECGTVANAQIQSTNEYTVTFENVTTIQYQVNPTIDDTSKVMLGAGVLVGPDTETNPTIVLNGSFKQYNWVNAADATAVSDQTITKAIIQGALDATAYNHTVNGKTASNLGIIYMNTVAATVTNNTGLPYELGNVTMEMSNNKVDGQVYSLKNATPEQIYSDYENANRATVNGDYMPTFEFDLGDQAVSYDGSEDTRYLYGDASGVTALYQDGDVAGALTLDLSKLATIYKYSGLNYTYTVVCKDSNGNELPATSNVVTLEVQGSYTLEFTVDDNIFYDENGNKIEKSIERTYTVPLTLTVKAADIKNAVVNITKTALDGVYTTVNLTDYKLRINFLDCISVTDYDNTGTGSTVDLTSNIFSATLTPASVNVFTTASTVTITYTDGRVLTVNLSNISGSSAGTKTATVNTSGGVYFITAGALNNKPTTSNNQNKCTITSVSFKGNSGSEVTNDTDVTVTWAFGSSSGCFAEGTLITLADGTQKSIEQITYEDELLAWDFNTGAYATTVPSLIESHEADKFRVINLKFADGTVARIIVDHGFFDVEANNFVYIDEENVDSYVGHQFVKVGENGTYTTTELVDYTVTVENVSYYTIQTAVYNNCIAENMFTLTSPSDMIENEGWFDYFEIGDGMKYDEEKKQADIEKYGLYTYDDFAEYVTYEQFIAFNGPYLKVLVGRGVVTYEQIIELINTYVNP